VNFPTADESLKLTSKSFDPSLFLRTVHANTSLADLERGIRYLEGSINERTDSLRAMVKNDFDRFVNAKSSIDGGSSDWKSNE
jgi:exocyst complex component 2